MVRHAAWTLTRYAFEADGQTSLLKLMRKDYHGEVAKLSGLVWFRMTAKQPKLAEQWRKTHWVGKSERFDEHLLAIRSSTCSARANRRKPRDEQWNFESVKEVHHDSNFAPARSNTALHKMLIGYRDHIRPIVERDSSLFGPRSLLKQKFQSVLKRKLQSVLWTEPAVAAGGQAAEMEANTDPVVE